ncbi:MAG: phosphopentomutase [Nitrospiraceae bacterium]
MAAVLSIGWRKFFCYSAYVITRVILIVLDGLGVGALPDAAAYGDTDANTLTHVAAAMGGLALPSLEALGLGHIGTFPGVRRASNPEGCFGKMAQLSKGKDSTTGHWEMAGLVLDRAFPIYPKGFPAEVIDRFEQAIGRKVIGNRTASGTRIIEELGEEHVRTGAPIVYTSADSVFQIAAHEQVIPAEDLYRICRTARKLLRPPHQVSRVIARPFRGTPGAFVRTPARRDFSIEPPDRTLLDILARAGQPVVGIGKIEDLFAGRNVSRSIHTTGNTAGLNEMMKVLRNAARGLVFVNLVDFDTLYGHRNDVTGYANALQAFDRRLPHVLAALRAGDALFVTSDHGNDPTTAGTDHSREYVPLLVHGPRLARGVNLGIRRTFADVGQTIADALAHTMLPHGESFLDALLPG